ncbi:MAG: hypothetical protein Q9228_003850, partial [Teloschistes exilis]
MSEAPSTPAPPPPPPPSGTSPRYHVRVYNLDLTSTSYVAQDDQDTYDILDEANYSARELFSMLGQATNIHPSIM